jgi:sugar lactone lactonase YvrE
VRRHTTATLISLPALLLASTFGFGIAAVHADDVTVINEMSFYPEQPFWYHNTLYYVEMGKDRVMKWDGTQNKPFWTRPGCGPTSVGEGRDGTLIVLCHLQNALAKVDLAGHTLRIFQHDENGAGFLTPNDSVNDDNGGLYFSSSGVFANAAPAIGAVYYLASDERIRKVASNIWYSNGVAISHDGKRLLVSEHLGRRVLAYPINRDGTLGGKELFLNLNDIVSRPMTGEWWVGPDGLLMDKKDNLYIAEYGAGRLLIVDSTGRLQKTLYFPEKFITAARFGSTEQRMFVTAPSNNTMPPFVGKVYEVTNPMFDDHKD